MPKPTVETLRVLALLLKEPGTPRYGLDLANDAGLKSGTIYPLLARLERAGWLTSDFEDIDPSVAGRRPRRYYRLTGSGEVAARAQLTDVRRQLGTVHSGVIGGIA
jgi:PadR family transcriptional regulator, regulatory protein PadR